MMRMLVLLFTLFAFSAAGQEVAGSISGQVSDGTGARVAGAEVVATHTDTGTQRRTTTNNEGVYAFPNLPIGSYDIAVSMAGFKKALRKGIALHVSDRLGIDVTLEVGELAQEVSVTATPDQVQTESAEQGGLISGDQVRELQLNGRSFMTLLELVPGVASNMGDRMDPNSGPNASINGARSTGMSFNIDGGNNADVIVGGSSLNTYTSVESIAEFTVLTSAYSAEYGRAGLSQINVVTRGGTKNFHGSVYEFFRNDALDARDYISHQVLPLRLNNFGYTLGGPVLLPYNRDRDKTFFHFTQEFNRISMRQNAVNTTVPLPQQKRGDFSGGAVVRDPVNNQPFPGNVIPSSRIDPNAVKLLDLYPEPNFRGTGTLNYTSAAPSIQNWREEVIRIDHNFAPSLTAFFRYVQDSTYVRNPYGGSGTSGNNTPWPGIAGTQSDRPGRNFVANFTKVIGPTVVNEARFAYARRYFDMFSTSTLASRKELGITIPELFPENRGDIIPSVTLTGLATLNVRGAGHKELSTFEFSDQITKTAGRHIIKTGAYYSYGGNYEQKFAPQTNGQFQFTNATFSGNAVANLLLGLPYQYTEVEKTVWTDARFSSFEAFIQDDFKATSRLTLNLGLRYATYFSPYDRGDVMANFVPSLWDPAKAPQLTNAGILVPGTGEPLNGIVVAGKNAPYGRKTVGNNAHLWGPRFGFAFAPFRNKKTVIRGGYGIFYTRPMLGTFLDSGLSNPPFSSSVTLLNPLLENPGAGIEATSAPTSLIALSDPMLAPTVQQWSLGVQREIFPKAILEVSYVGSHATHLMRPVNINAPDQPGLLGNNPGNRINTVRPYLGYGAINMRESSGSSAYHSLQASFNRRMSGGLTVGAAYTWGKSIDDGSSERGDADMPANKNNYRAERGISDFNRAHILTSNFIWRLPRGARGALEHPFLNAVLNGWQLSGIVRMWTGRPLDIVMNHDVAGIGAVQGQRPNAAGDVKGPRTPEMWFNRDAFARPANGTFGNLGRNVVEGPGVNKWDIAMFKYFRLREGMNLQFRGELFNAFNHPSFNTVGRTLPTTATGINPAGQNFAVVTDTRDARVVQFALKLTF